MAFTQAEEGAMEEEEEGRKEQMFGSSSASGQVEGCLEAGH